MHPILHRPTPASGSPAGTRRVRALRAIFGGVALAGMVTAAQGCDKRAASAPVLHKTSIASKPPMLFLLFGDRTDPRVLPLATLAGGHIAPVTLDATGWRQFDSIYFAPGAPIPVYRNGRPLTMATIRRGMWSEPTPLYTLPNCRSLKPLGAASITLSDPPLSLEYLATSEPLTLAKGTAASATPADLDSARAVASRAAQRQGFTKADRAELDLTVQAIATGATSRPTLVASYSEKGGSSGTPGRPARHLFVIADAALEGYAPTFVYSAHDSVPEFRRYIDHVDLTGDGMDEIVLEGWKEGGESYLIVLQFAGAKWKEVARGAANWCADVKP